MATTTIAGISYPVTSTYDLQGNTTEIKYPSGSRADYSFGSGGLINGVTSTAANGATSSIASFIDYAPNGKISSIVYPSGIITSYTYDAANLYRLSRLLTATSSTVQIQVPVSKPVYDLAVGGGGGGASSNSPFAGRGGGGGGQVASSTNYVSPQAYAITAGAGGAGGTGGNDGAAGSSSSFATSTARGGAQGTSSGGASGNSNAGGSQSGTSPYLTGGGGNGGTGSNGGTNNGGNGGSGTLSSLSGSSTAYAGGGGGGCSASGSCTASGLGQAGGGNGGSIGGNATANSGSGGGGGSGGGIASGGNGGSGIVIIRYPTGSVVATGGTISTTTSDTIHTFTSSGTFTVTQTGTTTATTTLVYPLLDLNYSYDSVGNITSITDNGSTTPPRSAAYTYDNLDRLLTASTTASSTSPYSLTYAYDALGNITSVVGATTTSYGYAQTRYANPDAPTSVGGVSYTYDNNGNVTSQGTTNYAYDYLNRMNQSIVGGATTTYGYDASGARMFQQTGTAIIHYPSRYFSRMLVGTTTATSTDYVFLGDLLLATIDTPPSLFATAIPAVVGTTTKYSTATTGTTTRQWLIATSTASNTILVLTANIQQATAGIGSIASAYLITGSGTTSLTFATTTRQSTARTEVWYLINPSSASSTITVTSSAQRPSSSSPLRSFPASRRQIQSTSCHANLGQPAIPPLLPPRPLRATSS
ncbi:glycine-rich domain-containing protein [Hyphomicrobium sp.]|uniref:glycine-rich domain-containing protein n=1 Tax=Hyphomicrobium sp. TaxID=82 RepID=UPI001D267F09|nr:hypothetical protein [Hyphomicrobium sp.]MBY0558556.1 hypothetical protein [Hyphomicrobium sp.]